MLKVAVVGTGHMGKIHLDAWSQISDAKVVACVSSNTDQELDAKIYSSLEELLENELVDVVDICVPTFLHAEFIKTAANAGKDIICEKPLARTTEEAEALIELCAEQKVRLLVGHVMRFMPEYADARNRVLSGAIGTPGVVRLSHKGRYPGGNEKKWYQDESKSGGIFLDLGIHDFDYLRWCFGDVDRVIAKRVRKMDGPVPIEYGLVTFKMESGVIAHIELSWAAPAYRASFEFAGSNGMLTYDSKDQAPVDFHSYGTAQADSQAVSLPRTYLEKNQFIRQFEHFTDCLLNNKEPLVTAEDALQAVAIAEAANRSAETGQPVEFTKRSESV